MTKLKKNYHYRKIRTEIQLLKYIDFRKCPPIFGKIYDKKSFLFNFAKKTHKRLNEKDFELDFFSIF